MPYYTTNELRNGMKVILDNDPYTILENDYVKPGKGQAFNRIKLRNLKNNRVIERTLKSGDSLAAADVFDIEVQYLYNDGQIWHFMATDTFEQYAADADAVRYRRPAAGCLAAHHRFRCRRAVPGRGRKSRRSS